MRFLTTILFIFISIYSFGQPLEFQKAKIEEEVEQIENNNQYETANFSIQALKKVLHHIRYTYIENSNGDLKITRQFSSKNDTTLQTFYVKNGDLIYATEIITSFYFTNEVPDSVSWSGYFYFLKGNLIDYKTLGDGKSEVETWIPGKHILLAFHEAKRDIIRHKKKRNSH